MFVAIIAGLAGGIVLGIILDVAYPVALSFYITVGLLAALDSVIGALRAHMEGKYNTLIFVTGFICNAALAALLAWLGDKLGVPLYYAAIIVFGGRLFNNSAAIRRMVIEKYISKKSE